MNRIVVITGGSSGIGKEMVEIYKNCGDNVFSLARSIPQNDYEIEVDVTNEQQVKLAIEQIGTKFGKIDILINCAGYGISGALELIPTKEAEKEFDVNMLGAFIVNKYAIRFMKKGSTIVHIASACALFAWPFRGLYCASKSALNM